MEQMQQKDEGSLSIHAVPQKEVEQACFHALGLITRNCEYLEQHLAHTGADAESCQAVADIGSATARLDRTINEVMVLLEYLRADGLPQLAPMDLCELLQQITAQADMIQAQVNRPSCVETTAMGAAYLAGMAVGYWKDQEEVKANWSIDQTFEPEISVEEQEKRMKGWKKAVRYSFDWAKDED